MPITSSAIHVERLEGFDDPQISQAVWTRLLRQGGTDAANLTWQWQRTWWDAFGRGELLLIAILRNSEIVAVAPLFSQAGMVFNICPEDHLDFVGDVSQPGVLEAVLRFARDCVDGFLGFRFYFIPDYSPTNRLLKRAAACLDLKCLEEADLACPLMNIAAHPDHALMCTRKKSLLRHERYFQREGELKAHHFRDADSIFPHLDEFFEQHIARRAVTDCPSLYADARQREYYRRLTQIVGPTDWLRFTRLEWNGRPIAFHYGLSYRGRFLFGIPSFAIDLAAYSPGEVLLRQLLLAALEEDAQSFDFGPGDEAYKHRFATHTVHLRTWGLYPR